MTDFSFHAEVVAEPSKRPVGLRSDAKIGDIQGRTSVRRLLGSAFVNHTSHFIGGDLIACRFQVDSAPDRVLLRELATPVLELDDKRLFLMAS